MLFGESSRGYTERDLWDLKIASVEVSFLVSFQMLTKNLVKIAVWVGDIAGL